LLLTREYAILQTIANEWKRWNDSGFDADCWLLAQPKSKIVVITRQGGLMANNEDF
jgi:hypothetical protein